ncbi:MAG: hypothetical protein JNM84_24345 [Planctomycetes bacterium]|nr:hypothetical protein [Planctomycetota bacterium]
MADEKKLRVRRLSLEVAELTAAERTAALARACQGDAQLRADVEALLRADAEAGGFLASSAGNADAALQVATALASEQAGAQIGRTKLLEQISPVIQRMRSALEPSRAGLPKQSPLPADALVALREGLLGSQSWNEAEPLLLDGCRGVKEREASIPPEAASRISEALERLVQLYEAKGNASEAARAAVRTPNDNGGQ